MVLISFLVMAAQAEVREIVVTSSTNLRSNESQILEVAAPIPEGTRVTIDSNSPPVFLPYRASDGSLKSSTNGFYPSVQLISVPPSAASQFPPERVAELNSSAGGLYLSSFDVNAGQDSRSTIDPLPSGGEPNTGYLQYFDRHGKRLRSPYSAKLSRRFGAQFNRVVDLSSLPAAEQAKWTSIYAELVRIGDRTTSTEKSHLFIGSGDSSRDRALAQQYSVEFEQSGRIQVFGAWNIAVMGTAVRHGFPNAPCAEFMSEVIRQAYTKAGYRMADDFRGNRYLIWSNTAAVVNLAQALYESGWIPWDPSVYRPQVGAIAMHADATTPGHTYLIAGADGRFLVDNGSPRGRDLWRTNGSRDYIGLMYDIGVFFLPPGILPQPW